MPDKTNDVKIFTFKWSQIDTFIYVTFIILFTTLLRIVQKKVKIFRNNVPESWFVALRSGAKWRTTYSIAQKFSSNKLVFWILSISFSFMMMGGMAFEAIRNSFDFGGDHWPQLTNNTLFWIIIPRYAGVQFSEAQSIIKFTNNCTKTAKIQINFLFSCMINCSMQMFNRIFFNNIFSILSVAVLVGHQRNNIFLFYLLMSLHKSFSFCNRGHWLI